MAKVTKKMNGEEKPHAPIVYDPAKPNHKFTNNQVALRTVYKEIVHNSRHAIIDSSDVPKPTKYFIDTRPKLHT